MADNGKGKAKEKFTWTEDLTLELMKCLKEFQRVHGYNQKFDWEIVSNEFKNMNGIQLPEGVAKNKSEYMKKLWRAWSELRFHVKSVEWNPVTGAILFDDGWWNRLNKTKKNKYRAFKKKGVLPELSDLWDDVYGNIVAAGNNVISSAMDPNSLPITITEGEGGDVLKLTDVGSKRCREEVGEPSTIPLSSSKRQCKQEVESESFDEDMAVAGETGNEVSSDVGSTNNEGGERAYYIGECFKVLSNMVAAGLIEEESQMWCFTVSPLIVDENRQGFMMLPSDSNRLAWIKFEYKKKGYA